MRRRDRGRSKHRRSKSKKKKTRNNNTKEARDLYTAFVDHVETQIDKDGNPHLLVGELWSTTMVYLQTSLKHVTVCDETLRRDVTDFYPGTQLNVLDNPNNEGVIYEILIPLEALDDMDRETPSEKKHSKSRRMVRFAKPQTRRAPNTVNLLLYIILLLVVIFGAAMTTTRDDWASVFAFVK